YKNDFRDWNPKEFDAKIANKWGFTTSTPFMHYYRIPLKGEKRYDVHRSTTRTIPIDAEPFTNIDSKHIIRKASVKVHCIPDDIKVELISAGTLEEFEPIGPSNPHTARQNDLDMVYPGLILPHQGYISVFTKVSLESSGVSDG
ncbi:MAG: hypothetical protein OEY38_21190, partial [Gammaproteobacteria bacterium]|nr:hypothetical protein [Gammaproteobacteria bacterium]